MKTHSDARVEPIEFHRLPAWRLVAEDGSHAVVTEHGAQVVSWVAADGHERLYLSPRSAFGAGAAIRGGVPVIFPQFSARGPLPRHGFARTASWMPAGSHADAAGTRTTLRLRDDAATRAVWPVGFDATLTVELAPWSLAITLGVTNTGSAPFEFSAALHTYLRVSDAETTLIDGLQGCTYEDSAAGGVLATHLEDPLPIIGEVDRIVFDTPPLLALLDGADTLAIRSEGFRDTVVWNPGAGRAATLADLGDGWREMVCVEAAVIGQPVALAPGASWAGTQRLEIPQT